MKAHDFSNYTYETNVPPGVGAEAEIDSMDGAGIFCIGQKTYRFAKRCMRNPELRAAIDAKVSELKAQGFFDAHPPKEYSIW